MLGVGEARINLYLFPKIFKTQISLSPISPQTLISFPIFKILAFPLLSCVITNCMPSFVFQGQIPYSLLHLHKKLFALPLKIFGCVCFAHDNRANMTQLDLLKYIFLRYSRTQEGYKCCDLSPIKQQRNTELKTQE